MVKKPCAVFTTVKNEPVFIPVWLKHYQNYFDNKDIYILNHQSTDGSTENLPVNVINVVNDLTFDHEWLKNVMENMQGTLLESYTSVLFAEVDELIYTVDKPLNDVITEFNASPSMFQTCTGYEVCQRLGTEPPVDLSKNIFEQRDYWYRDSVGFDKTLLSKKALDYVWGFHKLKNGEEDRLFQLFLCHLHKFDFELMLARHQERVVWKKKDDDFEKFGASWHQRVFERNALLKYFYGHDRTTVEHIPENHKKILSMLQNNTTV